MSYSANPVVDADRYWSPRFAAADRYERALADATHDLYMLLIRSSHATPYTWPKPIKVADNPLVRYPTAGEEASEALSGDPDLMAEAVRILACAARGEDAHTSAVSLLRKIASMQAKLAVDALDFVGD